MQPILSQRDKQRDALKAIHDGLQMAIDGAYRLAVLRIEDDQAGELPERSGPGPRGVETSTAIETRPAPLLTVEDVATYLKVKPQTIRDWARTGRIPFVPVNHEIRFRRSDIENGIRPDDSDQSKENIENLPAQNVESSRSISRPERAKSRRQSNGRV